MSEKKVSKPKKNRPSAMHGDVTYELHSVKAQVLFRGREGREGKPDIYGLLRFAGTAKQIYIDAAADNPWADLYLIHIDDAIARARTEFEAVQSTLDTKLPPVGGITIGEVTSVEPRTYNLNFANNFVFRMAYLIKEYDEFCCRVLGLSHIGLLTRNETEKLMNVSSVRIRGAMVSGKEYRYTGVTRDDVLANNQVAQKTRELLGDLPQDVLEMTRRSEYAPKIPKYMAQEAADEAVDASANGGDEIINEASFAAGDREMAQTAAVQ